MDNYHKESASMPFKIWHYITADVILGYNTHWSVSEKQKGEPPFDKFLRWDIDRCYCACM